MSFSTDIVNAILDGKVDSGDALQRLKAELCEKYSMSHMPSNPDILAEVSEDIREEVAPFLRLKPVRSLSGVAVVAVMSSPEKCPHGRCIYCPGGPEVGTAQSYTGYEPAARRASANDFDPFLQVSSRLLQLNQTGHHVDKIEMIVMGGTFPARDRAYQKTFIHRCFDAMNGKPSASIKECLRLNETAPSRCIGMTIETRPDQFSGEQIDFLMGLGMTRVELGVQTVFENCLSKLNRYHTVDDSVAATERAKRAGLKVCYHLMPGLPGSNIGRDIEMFRTVFDDPRFRPDMLKIYPTLVIGGTDLHEMWKRGEYEPPDTEYIVELLAEVKSFVPEWLRIQRVQRDIPVPHIEAGARKSNARELIKERMGERDIRCRCIRCREIGHIADVAVTENPVISEIEYRASGGTEKFIQCTDESTDGLIAFARLRIDSAMDSPTASLRELRVYGEQVPIDASDPKAYQHKGFGRELLDRCEELSLDVGASNLRITSGVGARGYYRRYGYELRGRYMLKKLLPR